MDIGFIRDLGNLQGIVSQLRVKSWYQLFADNTYADACLDRIVHKAFRLEFKGRNMRKGSWRCMAERSVQVVRNAVPFFRIHVPIVQIWRTVFSDYADFYTFMVIILYIWHL